MTKFHRSIYCLGLLFLFSVGCVKRNWNESKPKIMGGTETKDFPSVIDIYQGNCTATFVSKTTLLFAAHCIAIDRPSAVAIEQDGQIVRSSKVFHHGIVGDAVLQILGETPQKDFAIGVFEKDVAPAIMPIQFESPKAGEPATIVGYGFGESVADRGVKRFAKVTLDTIMSGQMVIVRETPATNQGDSGGPLIVDDKIVGIASFSNEKAGKDRVSGFALIGHPENIALMHKATSEGANIPGLPAPIDTKIDDFKVEGHTYIGNLRCQKDVNLIKECKCSIAFLPNGEMVWEDFESGTKTKWTYIQKKEKVLIGQHDTFKIEDKSTYLTFTLYEKGNALYDPWGRLTRLTK